MSFCALEEAFTGPPNPSAPPLKFKKMKRAKGSVEGFTQGSGVPPALPTAPGQGIGGGEVLAGPPPSMPPDESAAGVKMEDLFPLPGDTGGADEWQKAFTLEGSLVPQPQGLRADGSVSVAGQPTLWRQVAAPPIVPYQRAPAGNGWIAPPAPLQTTDSESLAPIPTELSQRLDVLTRQLESLTAPTHLQGTAELFLFVAIGLLLLLAIDTLLRFAVAAGTAVMRGGRRGRMGGFGTRGRVRWM
jgi:hypothetical protein